jgi:hypothetical protein
LSSASSSSSSESESEDDSTENEKKRLKREAREEVGAPVPGWLPRLAGGRAGCPGWLAGFPGWLAGEGNGSSNRHHKPCLPLCVAHREPICPARTRALLCSPGLACSGASSASWMPRCGASGGSMLRRRMLWR